ncbi:sugar ABC transporter substrate-binding protein [Microvirga tunisiensis]|nr:sugar ABC transporter substrate-binding protein [Microvirga tunisiensis]
MQKKFMRVGAFVFPATLMLAGTAAHSKDITIAFVTTNQQNPAEVSMTKGFKEEGEKLGAKVLILDARGSVEKMSNAVDDLIAQKVDGIAVIILDSVVAQTWVDKTNEAKIPFTAVAVQVGDPNKRKFKEVYPGLSALVGQDYISSGQRLGETAATMLPTDRTAKIGIVEGMPGYALVNQLSAGFKASLDAAGSKYKIVMSQPTDWTPAKGEAVCQNALVADPDIDLFFSHAEDMAIGCAKAIRDAGSKAKLFTAAGGSKLGIPLVKSGEITVSMCETWINVGQLGAKSLYEAATDPKTPKARLVEYKPPLITKDNANTCPPQW